MIVIKNNVIYYKSVYYVIFLVMFIIFGYIFFLNGINSETKIKVYYQNGSLVNYKLNYEDTSSLDNIDINYVYKSLFSEDITARYNYSISAYLHAYKKNIKDVIWFRKYDLAVNNIFDVNDSDFVEIKDNIKIDYKKYKKELDEFLLSEGLSAKGYLNIQISFMEYLNKKEKDDIKNIPKVINIDIMMEDNGANIVVNNVLEKDSYYDFNKHTIMNFIFVTLSMLCFSFGISFFFLIIKQFKLIGDRQNKYLKEVKRMLSKYDYCIIRVNKLYVSKKYNMIYVDNFEDLLDVYNSRNVMINYKETKRGMESIFVIIDSNDAWIYKFTSDSLK